MMNRMRSRGTSTRTRRTVAPVALLMVAAGLGPVAGASPAYAAELSPCVVPDNGRPQIHDIQFSPATVDVTETAEEVTLRMRIVDPGGPGAATGVQSVEATVGPDVVDARGRRLVELTEVGGDWWEGTFTVRPGYTGGAWRVLYAEVVDGAWNVLSDPDDIGHDFLLPFDDRTVEVTSVPDTEAPTITSLELSPKKVNTRKRAREIEVRVGAVDDMSGVASVRVAARGGDGLSVGADLTERDGDTFVGYLHFPKGWGRGGWRVRYLKATDEVGNYVQYFRRKVAQFGDREFRVVAPKRTADTRPPGVVWHKVRPGTIDIRQDEERVKVRARLRDRSGVSGASVALFGQSADMKRVRGTARDGIWVGRMTLDPCARFETKRGSIRAVDRLGNWRFHDFTAKAKVKRLDNHPPRPTHYDNKYDADEPVTFRFSEVVNGINAESVVVQQKNWPDPMGPPLAGTLTCRDGADQATSCADGEVREVTWVPSVPLTPDPGTSYRVSINPDGVLDVTDLRGNPVERDPHEPEDFFEFRVLG